MIYASVCDGIGAAHQAWHSLGWRCAWTSEIDPFPVAVVEQRWGLPNLGDMTAIDTQRAEAEHGRIELLVGGTPCQSFSVAGLRKGLDDPRGNLALVFLRLADRLRPRWVVWENVPGVLSSGGGRDFGSFLGGLGELGYGWAYRVLDAQYARVDTHPRAVPQRRRRVFVIGYLGDARRAQAVLFEREGMSGHPAPRRTAGQGFAADVAPSIVASGRGVERAGDTRGQDPVVAQPYRVGNPMTARMGKGINTTCDEGQTPVVGFCNTAGNTRLGVCDQHAPPVTARNGDPGMVAYGFKRGQGAAARSIGYVPVSPTLTSSDSGTQQSPGVCAPMMVRRIMPIEAERLMGLPDNYTLIEYRGKPATDGPRYKALGNSMAVNVMRWVGQRIEIAEGIT